MPTNALRRGAVPWERARTGRMTVSSPRGGTALLWRQRPLKPASVRDGSRRPACALRCGPSDLVMSTASTARPWRTKTWRMPWRGCNSPAQGRQQVQSESLFYNRLFFRFFAEIPLEDIKELPRTRSGLQSYRNHLIMELLWLQQAIVSRKNVRA